MSKAAKAKSAWRKDRITDRVDEATGRRIVELPTIKGMTTSVRDTLFAFEAEHLGTVKAVIRMNKRALGETPVTPHRLASAGIPKALTSYYGPVWAAAASDEGEDGVSPE